MIEEVDQLQHAREAQARLVAAARVVVKQADNSSYIGHDAIAELHRALKAVVPDLKRQNLDIIAAATAAVMALRSYQYGNSAEDLARECADHLESVLADHVETVLKKARRAL